MKAPKCKLLLFLFFFVMEFVSAFIICAGTRAQAKGNYLWTGITSIGFTIQLFMLQKMGVEDEASRSWLAGIGMTTGACAGDLLSIWATVHLFGNCD